MNKALHNLFHNLFHKNCISSVAVHAVLLLAVLLIGPTLAAAQNYQPLPFPQESNTALATADEDLWPWVPPVMAERSSATVRDEGSPFPTAANPSRDADSSDQCAPAARDSHDLGSPFPCDANPSTK